MSRELYKRRMTPKKVDWKKNHRCGRREWWNIIAITGKVLLTAILIAGALYVEPIVIKYLRGVLYQQESLAAKKLILEGNQLVSRKEVLSKLDIGAGDNLMEIDLKALAETLEQFPAVRSAFVKRQFPSTLYVRIIERKPLMIVGRKKELVIDDEGMVIASGSDVVSGLPLVTGVKVINGRLEDASAVKIVSELKEAALSEGLVWPEVFRFLDLSSSASPVAFLEGGVPVRLGRGSYREKLKQMTHVLKQITTGTISVSYIDLRFDRRVVVGTNPIKEEQSPGEGQVREFG